MSTAHEAEIAKLKAELEGFKKRLAETERKAPPRPEKFTTLSDMDVPLLSTPLDLEADGFLSRSKVGRRNRYQIHVDAPVRHHDGELTIGELLTFLSSPEHRASLGRATVVERGLARERAAG